MNSGFNFLVQWLADFEIAATLLLGATLIGMRWIRQPAQRVVLGWMVSLGLMVLLAVTAAPVWPRWHAVASVSRETGQPVAPAGLPGKRLGLDPDFPNQPQVGTEGTVSTVEPARESPSRAVAYQARESGTFAMVSWLGRLFLLGAALTGVWLVLGWIEAAWICRRARFAPARLCEQLQAVAGNRVSPPRLLLSGDIHNAVAVGILRPTILLPTALAEQAEAASVRAVLAHEVAHIRNRDLWLIGLLRTLLPVLFPQPLYWAMRQAIRASQEAVADAVAAQGRGHDYADGLIGWMRQVTAPKRMLPASAIGISEKPSELAKRITMLVDEQFTVQTSVSPGWRAGALVLIISAALGLSVLTVRPVAASDIGLGSNTNVPAGTGPGQTVVSAPNLADATTNAESFTGRVIDKTTHEPVQGATVHVQCKLASSTENRVVTETKYLTDGNGQFRFSLTPEVATNGHAYLNFEVTHPNYARRPWDGYSLAMIRKNASLGAPPFFEALDLTPAESISGTLVRPDGSPAAGVKILAYSKAKKDDMAEYGSFVDTRTDGSGFFQLNVVKGGEAVLWLLPQDFAPSTHLLHQQRGNLGQFTLEDGIHLSGQVLNSDGSPAGPVWVNAEIFGGPAKQRIGMPVIDALSRSALTDVQGRFTMGPLPAGDYELVISENPRDSITENRTFYPVPDVFPNQRLHLESGQAAATVEIRAVPHVQIGIQQLDSQGLPHKSHEVYISGQVDSNAWWGEARPDDSGKIRLKVPSGLTNVQLSLTVNEHQSTRYRWSNDSPWGNEDQPTTAILDHDLPEISVIYYNSPVLLVRAVAEDGSAVAGFKCQLEYAKGRKPYSRVPNWISGITGDVDFEKQPDGRWRSENLLPDETIQLTVQADGFQPYSQSINLPEGATREIDARLQKQ